MNATVSSPKNAMRQNLLEILSPHRWVIARIAVVILLGAGLELVPPLVMQRVVDDHLTAGNADGLWARASFSFISRAATSFSSMSLWITWTPRCFR